MTDTVSEKKRSYIMSQVGQKDTKPEIILRSLIHKMGYRFRLHRKDLPGSPDIVFPKYKKVIFVHGCFWHGHDDCKRATIPKTNSTYWKNKISKNKERDSRVIKELQELGWRSLILWSCEIDSESKELKNKVRDYLS